MPFQALRVAALAAGPGPSLVCAACPIGPEMLCSHGVGPHPKVRRRI